MTASAAMARAVADAAALEFPAVVGAASPEWLLSKIENLTLLIHATASTETAAELRGQRDVVKAEVLRRCEQ